MNRRITFVGSQKRRPVKVGARGSGGGRGRGGQGTDRGQQLLGA